MQIKYFTTDFAEPLRKAFGDYKTNWLCNASLMHGKVCLDIVAFDDYMTMRGYNIEQHGSLRNYVTEKFGECSAKLVESLIDGFDVDLKPTKL